MAVGEVSPPGFVDVRCEGTITHGPKKGERCGRFLISLKVAAGGVVLVRKKCERCKFRNTREVKAA
jgi:hypothetical protein